MIIIMLLNLLIGIFGFIANFIGGLLPSFPTEIKNVLDMLFGGLGNAVSFLNLIFDVRVLIALLTFWLIVWSLEHIIKFVIFVIFGRAKVE